MAFSAREPDDGHAAQSPDGPAAVRSPAPGQPETPMFTGVNSPPVTRNGVTYLATASLPTPRGTFQIAVARVDASGEQVLLLSLGDLSETEPPLIRLHSECLTGEVLGSLRCDCGDQLASALTAIAEAGRGVLIYLYQEGRGIGLVNKIRAYALQDDGMDTVDANLALGLPVDSRTYGAAAAVLRSLGVERVRLLTNNPAKCEGLACYDIEIIERVPLKVAGTPFNLAYLRTKAERMGHLLDLDVPASQRLGRNRRGKPQAK